MPNVLNVGDSAVFNCKPRRVCSLENNSVSFSCHVYTKEFCPSHLVHGARCDFRPLVYVVASVVPYEGFEEPCFVTMDKGQAEYVAVSMKKIRDINYPWGNEYEIFTLPLCGERI